MRRFVLWDTAGNFNDVIQKFKNIKCLITGTSTLHLSVVIKQYNNNNNNNVSFL